MSPYETQLRLNAYRLSPTAYRPDEVENIRKHAKLYSIPMSEESIGTPEVPRGSGVISQFSSGFTEGMLGPLALGGWSDEPQNELESIIHSAGHLLGFALPLAGSVLTGGGTGIARLGLMGTGKVAQGVYKTGTAIQTAGKAMKAGGKIGSIGKYDIPLKSVPMQVADLAEKGTKHVLARAGFEASRYMQKGEALKTSAKLFNTAFQAQHLAVASTVSGLFNGEDDEVDNFLFGAVAGGFFGGMGNFMKIGQMVNHANPVVREAGRKSLWQHSKNLADTVYRNREPIFKGMIGAGFQGGMATMHGAPTATQYYEYALGAFFGSQAHGFAHKESADFYNKFNRRNAEGKFEQEPVEFIDMIRSEGFKELSLDAQTLVKRSYSSHIGDFWDRATKNISGPSATLGKALESRFNQKIEETSKLLDKKTSELENFEIAEIKAKVLESLPHEFAEKQAMTTKMTQVMRDMKTPDKTLEGIDKEIVESLTPKDRKLVESGLADPLEKAIKSYFEKLPKDKLKLTIDDIMKAEEEILEQAETTAIPMLRRFMIGMAEQSEKAGVDGKELLNDAKEWFHAIKPEDAFGKPKSKLTEDYLTRFRNKYPQVDITPELENSVTNVFKQMSHGILRPIISVNTIQDKVETITGFNRLMKRVTGFSPKSPDEVIYEKQWGKDVIVKDFSEIIVGNERGVTSQKIYSTVRDPITFEETPAMQKGHWLDLMRTLNKSDEYLKIPNKDKGIERIYRYHKDTGKVTVKDIVKEVTKGDKKKEETYKKFIEYDKNKWAEDMGFGKDWKKDFPELENLYNKAFKSNYLYEKNYGFPNSQSRNKRESSMASKNFFPLDKEVYKDLTNNTDELNVIVIEAEKNLLGDANKKIKQWLNVDKKDPETYWVLDKNGNPKEMAWESKIDGWVIAHSDLYKRMIDSEGFKKMQMSHLKPGVVVEFPDGSLFMVKGGMHPGDKAYDALMKDKNTMIMVTSATKALPTNTKVFKGQAKKKGKKSVFELDGYDGTPSLKIGIEDFRINPGVYGDKHSIEPTSIKKQMHTFFDELTMSWEGFKSFMGAVHKEVIEGDPITTKYIDSLKDTPSALPPKGFDISKISDKHFVEIINDPLHPLNKALNLEIFKKIKNMEYEDEIGGEEMFTELRDYANNFERHYVDTGYHPVSSVLNANLYAKAVHIYRQKRFTHPRWENSGSGWVAGVDPVMELSSGGVRKNAEYRFWQDGKLTKPKKVGHFMLGHSHRKMKIDWIHGDKKIELGEAWEQYKNSKGTEEVKGRMRQKLMFAVMRVPANAISGTRGLLFDGFIESNVGLDNWGTYMRARDHFYIDGADVDGDKVFFYQGLPHKYMNDLTKHDSFLERKVKGKKVFFENKGEKYNKLFKSVVPEEPGLGFSINDYINNNPLSPFMPGALRQAGKSASIGKDGLGQVVNAKQFLNTVIADIITNRKGKLDILIHNKDGKPYARLKGNTSKKWLEDPWGYYVIGTEAHSRTADSANYYTMATPKEMVDIVFRSAFKNLQVVPFKKPKDGKVRKPRLNDLKYSNEYSHLAMLNNRLFGYNHERGRPHNVEEIQDAIRPFKTESETMSSIQDIAHKMAQNELNLDPLKHFNYESMRLVMKELNETMFKNKDLLRHIARNNLTVKMMYYSVDYKAVKSAMNKHQYKTSKGKSLGEVKDNSTKADREPYQDFIWEGIQPPNAEGKSGFEIRLGKEGRKIQRTFDHIFSNSPITENSTPKPISRYSKKVERELRLSDTMDAWSAINLDRIGKRLEDAMRKAGHKEEKGNIPWEDIYKIARKIEANAGKERGKKENFTEIEKRTLEKWSYKVQEVIDAKKSGKMPSKSEDKAIIFRDIISRHAEGIKLRFRHDFKRGRDRKFKNDNEASEFIIKDVQEITNYAKELKINPEIALEYYYNYLLGSLRPQHTSKRGLKTNLNSRIDTAKKRKQWRKAEELQEQMDNIESTYDETLTPKFIWSLNGIPAKMKKDFFRGYAETFDLMNKVAPKKIQTELIDQITKPKSEVKLGSIESKAEAVEVNSVEIDRIFSPDNMGKAVIKGVENKTLKESDIPNDIPRVLEQIKKSFDTLPDGALLRFEDLYTFMKNQQGSRMTSIKMATWEDVRNFNRYLKEIVESTGDIDAWFQFKFPDTIGNKMAGHDMGLLHKMHIPVRNKKNMGLATIKVPVSTMSFINKSGGLLREIEDSAKNTMVENLFNAIGVKGELEAINDGITSFTDLFMLAQKRMNVDRAQSKQSDARKLDFYNKEWADSIELYEKKYKNRKFKITRDGKIVERTSEQLMDDIIKQQSQYMEEMYENYIGAGVLDGGGNWKKIDWNIIDKQSDWIGNGYKYHDYIKYDKWGRFDIENFQSKVMNFVETFGANELYKIIGKRDNPLGVELLNRVQYEIGMEESMGSLVNPKSDIARQTRMEWRKKNPFFGVGRVGGEDQMGDFVTEYFPQMMHDKKRLKPWIANEQQRLHDSLNNFIRDLTQEGKRVSADSYAIPRKFALSELDIKALTVGLTKDSLKKNYGIEYNKLYPTQKLEKLIIDRKLELQRADFEMLIGNKVENATGQSDYLVDFLYTNFKKGKENWKDIGAEQRPGTGRSRGEVPMPFFSYDFKVLEAYTNQWVGSLFKNLNALTFRKVINNYQDNNIFVKPLDGKTPTEEDIHTAELWTLQMRQYASSLMGRPMALPTKYSGLTTYERNKLKRDIKRDKGFAKKRKQVLLRKDDRLKERYGLSQSSWKPWKNLEYRLSDQNMINYMEAKSMQLNNWLIPGVSSRLHGTEKNPSLFGQELPTSPQARQQVLYQTLNNIGAMESKLSLISLLAHPKTYLGNIMGGSQNTITNMGLRNFRRARDTQWLVQNVFKGAKLKDGTPITDKNTIHRWVSEIGALESFYINEAMMDRRIDSKKLMPFIKEVLNRPEKGEPNRPTIKQLADKYQVTDSFLSLGGQFMRASERTLRSDAFISHYLNARQQLSQVIPNMAFDHPYLTGMALKGVEATQFLYHNVNRPGVSRSAMGKVFTRFQPFMWNSIRFRRDVFKQAKRYGFADKASMERVKRLAMFDLTTMALANIFVGSIFDSILPPPLSYMQDTADWLFGDEKARERAFFSAYPSPILAPLQVATAPVNRFWMPMMTAMINGEWDRWATYYVHTLYPFGRLARSSAMTLTRPEMIGEFMFGIPIHKMGAMIRKMGEEDES